MNRSIKLGVVMRPYAKKARSTRSSMMEEPHNGTLHRAAEGFEVDIYDLNRACMAALASCATRGSTSPERRQLAEEIMLLADYVAGTLAGRAPEPVKRRQPADFTPEELEDWLKE